MHFLNEDYSIENIKKAYEKEQNSNNEELKKADLLNQFTLLEIIY